MHAESTRETTLAPSTLDALQELIRLNLDSYRSLAQVHDATDHPHLAALFRDIAGRRKAFAAELGKSVLLHDREAQPTGSLLAELHRWWVDLTGKLESGDTETILEEALRGEAALRRAYDRVLEDTAGSPVHEVLQGQARFVDLSVRKIEHLLESARRGWPLER